MSKQIKKNTHKYNTRMALDEYKEIKNDKYLHTIRIQSRNIPSQYTHRHTHSLYIYSKKKQTKRMEEIKTCARQ